MLNKKNILIAVLILAVIMSFIFLNMGHFLFKTQEPEKDGKALQTDSTGNTAAIPVRYVHLSEMIGGSRQEMDMLEVDVSHPEVKVQPVLSFDLIYGFENLSAMVAGKKAYAAVNGGFFREYGLPSGMVAIDGSLITVSTGKYPVFTVSGGKASLSVIQSRLWLEYNGGQLKIDRLNAPARGGETAVYTPVYGSSSRAKTENLAITVINNRVVKAGIYAGEADIPDNGMLITFFDLKKYGIDSLPFKIGDTIKLIHEPDLPEGIQAYECGSWIVRDGKVVIGDRDEWVGVLTNRDPRTAIGVRNDGRVVLFTVDGRQPGYSAGLTGRELGEFLLGQGVENAAMLDGGASTEMIVDGKIVNKPSYKGQERPLGGGVLVILEK